jgi:alkanesulfonate monooxygenase SsuD/methylene tetrahydromethanopterin reductase-like flavin-dependent oxidoreductase (luciferase family)
VLTESADPDAISAVAKRFPGAKVLATLSIMLGESGKAARDRRSKLDAMHGKPFQSSGIDFVGRPGELASVVPSLADTAGAAGFLVRPALLPADLEVFAREVVPALKQAGAIGEQYRGGTLREHLGLPVGVNQYEVAHQTKGAV